MPTNQRSSYSSSVEPCLIQSAINGQSAKSKSQWESSARNETGILQLLPIKTLKPILFLFVLCDCEKNHDKHNLWEERCLFHYSKIAIFHREQVTKYQISHLPNSQIATPKDWRGDLRPQDVSISKNEQQYQKKDILQ